MTHCLQHNCLNKSTGMTRVLHHAMILKVFRIYSLLEMSVITINFRYQFCLCEIEDFGVTWITFLYEKDTNSGKFISRL